MQCPQLTFGRVNDSECEIKTSCIVLSFQKRRAPLMGIEKVSVLMEIGPSSMVISKILSSAFWRTSSAQEVHARASFIFLDHDEDLLGLGVNHGRLVKLQPNTIIFTSTAVEPAAILIFAQSPGLLELLQLKELPRDVVLGQVSSDRSPHKHMGCQRHQHGFKIETWACRFQAAGQLKENKGKVCQVSLKKKANT